MPGKHDLDKTALPPEFTSDAGLRTSAAAIALGFVMFLLGCASSTIGPDSLLDGTSWRLLSIQSMDDAQGTVHIPDPTRFTLAFGADGRASLRLDCNRATGAWFAKPSGDGTGSLQFGPIAATRMVCLRPSLGERVGRDLGFVRGYRLKDGRLYLSLMADGGILEWEPDPSGRAR